MTFKQLQAVNDAVNRYSPPLTHCQANYCLTNPVAATVVMFIWSTSRCQAVVLYLLHLALLCTLQHAVDCG
ncbi:hypothetical protein BKA82DRAFT_1002508 [Pisolithus tinctorius]|uniref:Uncharacterized protein n=1 Tax=Pisolithus tinctorius Marx 270 TaxID=870435 RepID=A0A0C3P467_PISTI|nr:hypothetical protein BKA82DRAFT_1002508 [Pisolithus tinctorius]KIO02074.1 hypothetical protein M404DRAFT_1002508 [Pisolithus tinctorius Marx 270]